MQGLKDDIITVVERNITVFLVIRTSENQILEMSVNVCRDLVSR